MGTVAKKGIAVPNAKKPLCFGRGLLLWQMWDQDVSMCYWQLLFPQLFEHSKTVAPVLLSTQHDGMPG